MRRGADAVDADILGPEGLRHSEHELFRASLGVDPADVLDKRLELGEPLLTRIDRAADRRARRFTWLKNPHRGDEILEEHRRAARLDPHHAAGGVGDPALGRTGDDDFPRLAILGRIDKHILHAGEAGEPGDIVGDVAAFGRSVGHFGLQPRQRHLAERRTLADVAGKFGIGSDSPLPGEPRVGDEARPQDSLGIDHDTGGARRTTKTATTTALATATHATATLATAAHATAAHATPAHAAAALAAHAAAAHAAATHAAATHTTLAMGKSGGRDHHGEGHDRRRQQRGETVHEGHPVSEGLEHGRTRRKRNGLPTLSFPQGPGDRNPLCRVAPAEAGGNPAADVQGASASADRPQHLFSLRPGDDRGFEGLGGAGGRLCGFLAVIVHLEGVVPVVGTTPRRGLRERPP